MKIYIIWIISILKFFLVKKRFLLLSPPFLEKQYFYDRKSKRFFLLYNRNKIDWGTNWQVFLDDQFSLPFTNYNDTRNKDLLNYTKKQNNNNKTPIIIDCGSNTGASSIYFKLTYPKSKIIGLEIDKNNFLHSRKNVETNQLDIDIINEGISCDNGFGNIINPEEENNAYQIQKETKALSGIPLISIDTVLKTYFNDDKYFPYIIKIDIEGGEEDLFQKNTNWINYFPMIIIELHDWLMPKKKTSINFLRTISKENRDFIIKGENVFSIKNNLD